MQQYLWCGFLRASVAGDAPHAEYTIMKHAHLGNTALKPQFLWEHDRPPLTDSSMPHAVNLHHCQHRLQLFPLPIDSSTIGTHSKTDGDH